MEELDTLLKLLTHAVQLAAEVWKLVKPAVKKFLKRRR